MTKLKTSATRMEAEAIHDFIPNDPATEMAFNRGDRLLILNYGEGTDWFKADKNGEDGMVPGNYIRMEEPAWYKGRISRVRSEQMLQCMPEGAFLVRLSESAPDSFSLSVKVGDSVQHFRILKDSDRNYFLWQTRFKSLNQLVEHYKTLETVSRTSSIYLRDVRSFTVVAMFDFAATEGPDGEAELGFRSGEVIDVFDNSDENWWGGSIGNRKGYFPRSYVRPCEPDSIS